MTYMFFWFVIEAVLLFGAVDLITKKIGLR
jgi:hypothetical protein